MKLAALFARYLYQHKELKLPGIGIFTLDSSVVIPDSTDKSYYDFTQQIRFSQTPVAHADDAFINFIRTETGKIKPLAESDLDSFLSDGKILLNIGKPFHFDGIGYLQKNREGVYQFTPGDSSLPRPTPPAPLEKSDEIIKNKMPRDESEVRSGTSNKTLIGLATMAGLIFIVWLGYTLYDRSSANNRVADAVPSGTSANGSSVLLDSVQSKIDSARQAESNTATGSYRFIIEKNISKARALRRYRQIKESKADIRMESRDSTLFNLFLVIPAQPSDTARIRDSLKIWYARKRVWVE